MKKIITIVGARPQFVKAAVVSRAISKIEGLTELIVHTGQHFDHNMSDVFFEEMDIPKPAYNLEISGMTHGKMTGKMLEGIEAVLIKEKPDLVLIYGDTNSTLAGALAAKKMHIKVAHVEAGLRSYNMAMPEEINRILSDRISDYLFCPTDKAIDNLKKEGFENIACTLSNSGDVMFDAVKYYKTYSKEKSKIISDLRLENGEFLLATVHRQENTDNLKNLAWVVSQLNELNEEQKVVWPIHPRTKNVLKANKLKPNFELVDPVGYFDMIELLDNCRFVVTDSGGLQKEAYFFNKFCITLRNETEWTELVDNGFNYLNPPVETISLSETIKQIKESKVNFGKSLYGDGNAGEKIAKNILSWLK